MLTYSHTAVRGDDVGWFDGDEPELWPRQTLSAYLQKVDTLIAELGPRVPQLSAIGSRSKAMCACYPGGGARYVKHRDALPYKAGRKLTVIYYLNEQWEQGHGGELRIWPTDGSDETVTIEPLADRLLLFYADYRVPHEVLPAHVPRLAVTLWYFDRDEHAKARTRGVSAEQADGREAEAIEAEIAKFEEKFGHGAVRHDGVGGPAGENPACNRAL